MNKEGSISGGKSKEKKVIFIDLDGTLFDTFKECDGKIVREVFGKNGLLKSLDNFLWKINALDIISNSMWILKLRILLYSLITFKSYRKAVRTYKHLYAMYLKSALDDVIKNTNFMELYNYFNIVIVTNNEFSVSLIKHYFDDVIFAKNGKYRLRYISERARKRKVAYIVGNNYMDDIKIAKELGIKSIYVGRSKFQSGFGADISIPNFVSALANIIYDEFNLYTEEDLEG